MKLKEASQIVDHLFRYEYGKMVAVLSRFLGLSHLEAIEDIIQESFIQAIRTWRPETMPSNPGAWLLAVAKRKAIDYVRKKKSTDQRHINAHISGPGSASIEELFLDDEISDSQLRMIFTCCHPDLRAKDQVALTLKIASGFSLGEISNALLSNTETIKKRIQRAKIKFQNRSNRLIIPKVKS